MVDPTTNTFTVNTAASDSIRVDQPESAAEKWYRNALAVIKLK